MGWNPRGSGLFPEPTWWNGDDDRDLGPEPPEPPPCVPIRHCVAFLPGKCIDCGAPEGECWWNEDIEESDDAAAERG